MKMIAPLSLFALVACAAPGTDKAASQAEPLENAADVALQECDTAAGQYAMGKPFTDALAAELMKKVGAASMRVIAPGTMVTMDYRSDRLNIGYDEKKVINKVDCG